jgi:thiamine biosynthesis lipoprotein
VVLGALLALSGCPTVQAPHSAPPSKTASTVAPEPEPAPVPHSASRRTAGERVQMVEKAMGTRVTLAGYTTASLGPVEVNRALRAAHDEIKRIEVLMTTWQPTSEVSRINAAAGKSAVKVGRETLGVVAKSVWISELSEGTFDVTFASMGKLWSFDEDLSQAIPDAALLETARKKIDYRKIVIDDAASTVMLASADTKINLGGIAKGYAIDQAAKVLRSAGLASFFAQAGGDLYVEGRKPNGEPWRVGVRDPRGADGVFFALLPVENHAFSTAGDYERAFVKDGKRYHHIIDPRTGYPATASRSVTIWAKDALTADAIDDAVFILGPEKGIALVESLPDCGAVIVAADNSVHVSSRLKNLVQILRQPTGGI